MKNRTSGQSMMKVLALALALIMTLGNLPLMSFAEEVGQASQYTHEYQAYFFFATADYETDPHGRLNYHHEPTYWFPKVTDTKVIGKIYSNTLDFTTGLVNYEHAVYIPQVDSDSYPDLFQKKKAFSDQIVLKLGNVEFDPNDAGSMNRQEVREAFKTAFEKNGVTTFKITDSNKNEIEFTPKDFLNPEYKLRVMRYKRNDTSANRIHVDMYIERGEAQPITLIEYIDDVKQPETTTQNPKFGDPLELGKENYTIEKVTISVEGEGLVTLTPKPGSTVEEQLKSNPIKHDGKKKTVEVWYKTKAEPMSGGIEVKPYILEGKEITLADETEYGFKNLINPLTVDPNAVGTEEKIKIIAPEGLWVQKVWIGNVESGAVEHGAGSENEVYTVKHTTEKQVLHVYYNKKKPEFEIIALLPDGTEQKLNDKFQGVYGEDYTIPMDKVPQNIADNHSYAGYTLNSKDGDKTDSNTIPGADVNEKLKTVYLHYGAKAQTSTVKIYKMVDGVLDSNPVKEDQATIGSEYKIPVDEVLSASSGYTLKGSYHKSGASINDNAIPENKFTPTEKEYEIVIVLEKNKPQPIQYDIKFISKKMDESGPYPEDQMKYTPGSDEDLGKLKDLFNSLKNNPPQFYDFEGAYIGDEKIDIANLKHTDIIGNTDIELRFVRKDSKVTVKEYVDGKLNTTKTENAKQGKDYTITLNSTYIKDSVKLDNAAFNETKFMLTKDEHILEIYYKTKPSGGDNTNPGDNNNNNGSNDAGGIGGPGNDNNNGGNNGGSNGGSTGGNNGGDTGGGYQPYDPGKNSSSVDVTVDGDETPLGTLNTDDFIAYIQGYPEGDVRPERFVNREETAAIFFRLLDPKYRDSIRSEENNFSDISKINWSNKHISTLAKGGIIKGYADGSFRPTAAITRGELAVIAAKFDKLQGSATHNFTDMKGHWAEKYVASASAKGWIKGYPNGEFRPDMPITRAEFVTFVNKVLNRNVKKAEVLPGVRQFTDLTKDAWYYEAMVTATNSYLAKMGDDGYQKWTELIKPVIEM